MPNDGPNALLEAALLYASLGWRVVAQHTPRFVATGTRCSCDNLGDAKCENVGKHPRYDKDLLPAGMSSATSDPELIRKWWDLWPDANISLAAGKESGIIVIDVDPPNGGKHSLDRIEAMHGRLPSTVYARSGRGIHLYYRYPSEIEIPSSMTLLGKGLELKSDGSGITAPPSLHEIGTTYTWIVDPTEEDLADLPSWLIDLCQRGVDLANVRHLPSGPRRVHTLADKIRRCRAYVDRQPGAPKGARKQTLIRVIANIGLDFDLDAEDFEPIIMSWAFRCDPPLEENHVLQAIRWAYRPGRRRRDRGYRLDEDSQEWLAAMEVKRRREDDDEAYWAAMEPLSAMQSAPANAALPAPAPPAPPARGGSRKSQKPTDPGDGGGRGKKPPAPPGPPGPPGPPDDDDDEGPSNPLRFKALDPDGKDLTYLLLGPDRLALTEIGNGQRIVRDHGRDIRFDPQAGKTGHWYLWDGKRWKIDRTDEIVSTAVTTARSMNKLMTKLKEDAKSTWRGWIQKSESRSGISASLYFAGRTRGISVESADFDAEEFLVNTQSGIYDIRTQKMTKHRRSAMMSKITAVGPDSSKCKRWLDFLNTVMDGNREMIDFLQLAAGYTFTGSTREECIFLCYGTGKNGKSTFINTLQSISADYAKSVRFDTFLERKRAAEAASSDLAMLMGARLVVATEPPQNQRMDEATIKWITGRDIITARFLFSEHFEYQPRLKIWLASNHQPEIRGVDEGIWRRIRLIPFTVEIPEKARVPELPDLLREEYPGILNWILEGAHKWYKHGHLFTPKAVQDATQQYRDEMDRLADFIHRHCTVGEGCKVRSRELYEAYKRWSEQEAGEKPMGNRYFTQAMKERSFSAKRERDGMMYHGIGLRQDPI